MENKDQPQSSTDLLLGQVIGELRGLKTTIDAEFSSVKTTIVSQNQSLEHVKAKINSLPCAEHSATITSILAAVTKEEKENAVLKAEKRKGRSSLVVALIAALVTGFFTVGGLLVTVLATGG